MNWVLFVLVGWFVGGVGGFILGWALRYLRIKSLVSLLVQREFTRRDEARAESFSRHPAQITHWETPGMVNVDGGSKKKSDGASATNADAER